MKTLGASASLESIKSRNWQLHGLIKGIQCGWALTRKMTSSNRPALLGGFLAVELLLLSSCGPEERRELVNDSPKSAACLLDISKWFPGKLSPPNRVANMEIHIDNDIISYNDRTISENGLYESVKTVQGLEPSPYIHVSYQATRRCGTVSRIAGKIDAIVDCREARCSISVH